MVTGRIQYALLSKQKSNNMAVEKKEVTVKFYGQWCLPVITWYKKYSLEQVLPKFYQVLYTLHKKFFTVATFKDLWVDPFQAD